jgi:Helicase conserved C-terminal domain
MDFKAWLTKTTDYFHPKTVKPIPLDSRLGSPTPNQLAETIDSYTADTIQTMCNNRGIFEEFKPAGPKRQQRVRELVELCLEPQSLKNVLANLSPAAIYGLTLLKSNGGILEWKTWRNKIVARFGQADSAEKELVGGLLALYAEEQGRRLQLATGTKHKIGVPGFRAYNCLLITFPQVLEQFHPDYAQVLAPPVPESYTGVEPHPANPAGFEALLGDLFNSVRYLESAKAKILQSGELGKKDYPKLYPLLSQKETKPLETVSRLSELSRLSFLWEVLIASGMVENHSGIAQVNKPKVEEFYGLPRPDQIKVLTMAWLNSRYNDFVQIPTLKFVTTEPQYSDVPNPQKLKVARELILNLLIEGVQTNLIREGWYSLTSLSQAVRSLNQDLLISRQGSQLWLNYSQQQKYGYYGQNSYNGFGSRLKEETWHSWRSGFYNILSLERDWDLVEREWLAELFREPLAWLGLAELGSLDPKAAVAFRLTAEGRAIFGNQPLPDRAVQSEQTEKSLLVQPNFEVLVLAPYQNMAILHRLARFAVEVSRGEVAILKITRESVLVGMRSGLSGTEMLEFLRANSRVPLAQNLTATLMDWHNSYTRLQFQRKATLLEVADPKLLDKLLADPEIGVGLEERLSPTAVLVKTAHFELIGGKLKALLGTELPKLNYAEVKSGAISLVGERKIRVKSGEPYVYYRLGQFADLVEWQAVTNTALFEITIGSGERAKRLGIDYFETKQYLEAWGGKLSPAMDLVLKHELGYYGEIMSERAVILRVAKAEQLDDIFSLAEFTPLLIERATPKIAIVRESLLPQYSERLRQLGIIIRTAEYI